MPTPSLRHAVLHHCNTPVDYWDGTNFVTTGAQINFDFRSKNALPSGYHVCQGDFSHPFQTFAPNVIRDAITGHTWVVVSHKIQAHRATTYATLYRIFRSEFQVDIMGHADVVDTSPNGMRYATKVDGAMQLLETTWMGIEGGRVNPSPRPMTRTSFGSTHNTFIDGAIDLSRAKELHLHDGRKYLIQEIVKEDVEASQLTLTLIGDR